jgi:hypothetical protein
MTSIFVGVFFFISFFTIIVSIFLKGSSSSPIIEEEMEVDDTSITIACDEHKPATDKQ